jgi:hypothetical protein
LCHKTASVSRSSVQERREKRREEKRRETREEKRREERREKKEEYRKRRETLKGVPAPHAYFRLCLVLLLLVSLICATKSHQLQGRQYKREARREKSEKEKREEWRKIRRP